MMEYTKIITEIKDYKELREEGADKSTLNYNDIIFKDLKEPENGAAFSLDHLGYEEIKNKHVLRLVLQRCLGILLVLEPRPDIEDKIGGITGLHIPPHFKISSQFRHIYKALICDIKKSYQIKMVVAAGGKINNGTNQHHYKTSTHNFFLTLPQIIGIEETKYFQFLPRPETAATLLLVYDNRIIVTQVDDKDSYHGIYINY